MRRALLSAGVVLGVLVGGITLYPRQQQFPHARHAGLFPTCAGCHRGVAEGDTTAFYSITAEECAACHDGTRLKTVELAPPHRHATNLRFTHAAHSKIVPLKCEGCHKEAGTDNRMAVRLPDPMTCLGCHQPDAKAHVAWDTHCAKCHFPLAEATALSKDDIAEFPKGPDHEDPDFVLVHGRIASQGTETCATCHTRDSCARCHLNAEQVPAIAGLGTDARVAALVAGRPGVWPKPASHEAQDWAFSHFEQARASIETCANCHARQSCETCHSGASEPAVIAKLPSRPSTGPAGVRITRVLTMPPSHTADWISNHASAASMGAPNCSTCHTETFCSDCHAGAAKPDFHPADFVTRHATEAFANENECASCHSREAFCRDCHTGLGMAASGSTGASFHDAQPDWLLAHGQAARQDLESCTTCHEQRSCLRCHSAKTGWRVNPHGSGFDGDDVAGKSTQACAICHFSLPTEMEGGESGEP